MKINKIVYFFDKTIKTFLSNYIRHEVITCDDSDPQWINKTIKRLIQLNNNAYKCYNKITKIVTCLGNKTGSLNI